MARATPKTLMLVGAILIASGVIMVAASVPTQLQVLRWTGSADSILGFALLMVGLRRNSES